jgi:hypothetical protein
MTILAVANEVWLRINQQANHFSALVSNQDDAAQYYLSLARQVAEQIVLRANNKALLLAAQIIGDGVSTLWNLPTEWQRMGEGMRLVSTKYPLLPLQMVNDDDLIAMKALPSFPVRPVWRRIGPQQIELWPAISVGELVNFEFESKYWVIAQDGVTRKSDITADTDSPNFDEILLRLGMVYKWKNAKGVACADDLRDFEAALDLVFGQDTGLRIISTSTYNSFGFGDSNWPGIIIDNSFGH